MYNQNEVNEYYEGAPIYEAMEIWSLPKTKQDMLEEICANGEYFAQIKKDGNWYEFSKATTGECYLFSRGVSKKTGLPVECIKNVPHIKTILQTLPNDTVLVGEIYYPHKTTNEVRSIMGCLPKKALERQKEKGNIHFYLFDILRFNGEDLISQSAQDRYNKLVEVCANYNLIQNEVELAHSVYEDIYSYLSLAFANGEEGLVLKKKTEPYTEGKRPAWASIKCKEHDTIDAICMGFEDATKEYDGKYEDDWPYWIIEKLNEQGEYTFYDKCREGDRSNINSPEFRTIAVTRPYYYHWKTAIRIGLYKNGELVEIGTVSSGLTDFLREDFYKNPDEYIGKVVKIDCMRKMEDTLRHPRFIEFRSDKTAESCTFESVF